MLKRIPGGQQITASTPDCIMNLLLLIASLNCAKGTGSARHLCIYTETLAQLGTGQSMSMLEPKLREKVKGVWRACQAEGGKFWGYSQDEIAELLMSSAGLPEDIAQLMLKRYKPSACSFWCCVSHCQSLDGG